MRLARRAETRDVEPGGQNRFLSTSPRSPALDRSLACFARFIHPRLPDLVTHRGNREQAIFMAEQARLVYREMLADYVARTGHTVSEYALTTIPKHRSSDSESILIPRIFSVTSTHPLMESSGPAQRRAARACHSSTSTLALP